MPVAVRTAAVMATATIQPDGQHGGHIFTAVITADFGAKTAE